MADKFRDIVARVGAVFREQRKIEARRALQRYRHLLARPDDTLPLNEVISVAREEDIPGHAYGTDARERTAGQPAFERT
ncbi:hypothetical protein [Bradyrhizobium guangxiense]|uniref:hypothetical protein n=1 Tax=Bradyrhizobium guangxiense TaxID=1325115 RepID=UPI001FE10C93|nr:hypothetical protein [Bradyrhizobium guangxiense]